MYSYEHSDSASLQDVRLGTIAGETGFLFCLISFQLLPVYPTYRNPKSTNVAEVISLKLAIHGSKSSRLSRDQPTFNPCVG